VDRSAQSRSSARASVVVVAWLLLGALLVGGSLAAAATAPCWPPPVAAPVTVAFTQPSCPYCAGHRGLEFGTDTGEAVIAVADGRVSFAGQVAGVVYIVVDQRDGLRATYGRVAPTRLAIGAEVRSGEQIATTAGAFYFGLRRPAVASDKGAPPTQEYIDPAPYLGKRRYRVRLVPTDGSARPPAGPGRLECPIAPAVR